MNHSKVKTHSVFIDTHLQFTLYIVEAVPGDIIGFHVKDLSAKELRRGYIASDITNDPAQEIASFTAQVRFLFFSRSIFFLFLSYLDYCSQSSRCN